MSPLSPSPGSSPDDAATRPSPEVEAGLGAGAAPGPPPPEPTTARLAIGLGAGAAVAALGGWILGEYPFTGVMPYLTGVLFALVVAEVMLSISLRRDWAIGAAACLATVGGIGLAVWIQSGEGLVPIPVGGWVAIGLGAVVSVLRGGLRMGAKRG